MLGRRRRKGGNHMGSEGESATTPNAKDAKDWVEDLQRTVIQSKDSALRSARSLQQNSSTHLRSLQVLNFYSALLIFQLKLIDFFFIIPCFVLVGFSSRCCHPLYSLRTSFPQQSQRSLLYFTFVCLFCVFLIILFILG